METSSIPASNWKFDHVGIVVRDMDEAIVYYQALGIGPFEIKHPGRPLPGSARLGLSSDVEIKIRVADLSAIRLELIQPVKGESIHRKFFDAKGEGVDHVCFQVDDIDEETENMIRKGFRVILSGRNTQGGGGFTYFDTDQVGGIKFELVQWPQSVRHQDQNESR